MPQIILLPLSLIIGQLANIKANSIKWILSNENLLYYMLVRRRQHMRV
jgi:hypothetical protein